MRSVRLSKLLAGIAAEPLDPGDPEVTGVVCDSRAVRPGYLFAAIRGARADGHAHLERAAKDGAVAGLVERPEAGAGMVRVRVPDSEHALGRVSSAFWGNPSRRLRLVGITGTNGKTTTAYLVQHLLSAAGMLCGRLGTVSYSFPSGEQPAPLTTPDAPSLQAALARMVAEQAAAVVMEVSSHALVRQRVEGCCFACAAFTNLTQDHLDYHGDMESYFEGKRLLFRRYAPTSPAVVNADDAYARRLLAEIGPRAVSYGLEQGDLRVHVESLSARGCRGQVEHAGSRLPLELPLAGDYNASNAACALAVVVALGLPLGPAVAALARCPQVPGRLEAVPDASGVFVFVDYAHTPDALDGVLRCIRGFSEGKVVCVFGCGGDRDRGKRPRMARAAAQWADGIVLTADNSRSEPTEAILAEIEAGMPEGWLRTGSVAELRAGARRYAVVADRARAIRAAVAAAQPGDTVLIAGKGHETTQTIGGTVTPFDDRIEARAALAERAAA
jgi:UDP-N-acetylmuramoyl-L-alanyl-D-glutamate--2,6-diaminopimelate ligase